MQTDTTATKSILSEYIARVIVWCAQAVLFGIALHQAWHLEWSNLFIVLQAMALGMAPYILQHRFGIYTPPMLRAGIVLFMIATLVLGEIADFYNTYTWWDAMLHTLSSVGLALIGFMLLVNFFKSSDLTSTPFLTSFLAFSFAMSLAVLWEIYEFFIDLFFSPRATMQPSNTDTMTDLIVATVGALLVSIGGYRFVRWRERNPVGLLIKDGVDGNGGDC